MAAEFPPPLAAGDRVGVAALSGPVRPERIEAGLDGLRALGFEPVQAPNLASKRGFLAGPDHRRLEAFHALVDRPEIKAIVFARGGYGLTRLQDALDWSRIASVPRFYVGYSDVTPFLNGVVERCGWVAVHGPMVAVEWAEGLDPSEEASLLALLAGRVPEDLPVARVAGVPGTVRDDAEGILMGGCLSLLAATQGTDFAPRLEGAVLFWEDVDEPLYRIDRMLTQLALAGSLAGLRGMVVGRNPDRPATDEGTIDPDGGLEGLLAEWAERLGVPVAWNLSCGHCRPNHSLGLGLRVRLDLEAGKLRYVHRT